MKWLLGNPYAIGVLVMSLLALVGGNVALYYRSEAATERAASATRQAEQAQHQIDEMGQRLFRTNQSLSAREAALQQLRSRYETDSRALRTAPDPSGCADSRVPRPIIRLLAPANADGDGRD